MTQPEDEGEDHGSRELQEPAASGPAACTDPTTQADAGMSGEEAPADLEPHAEPSESGPDDEQPSQRDRRDRPADDVAAAATIREREAISEDRDAAFHEPK